MTFSLNIMRNGYSSIPDDDNDGAPPPHAEAEKPPRFHRAHAALATGLLALVALTVATKRHGSSRIATTTVDPPPPTVVALPENEPHFYDGQLVDHLGSARSKHLPRHWRHRYYRSTEHFGGPGYPIILVVGGEGALNDGMLYPYVTHDLARRFGAAVVQPEHRFYGPYQPLGPDPTVEDRLDVFTPAQAMEDMLRLVMIHLRGPGQPFERCSPDRTSIDYCPLVTVGASYPGFLSAMFRLLHSDVVDMAYASSAPLLMYAQETDNREYYDIVTRAADRSSPGCAAAVKKTFTDIDALIVDSSSLVDAARAVGVCTGEDGELLPKAFETVEDLAEGLNLMAVYGFANNDMGVYPPGPNVMYKVCRSFQDDPTLDSVGTLKSYFREQALADYEDANGCDGLHPVHCTKEEKETYIANLFKGDCKDMRPDFGPGPHDAEEDAPGKDVFDGLAYDDGESWEFQTCTNLIFLAGTGNESMFPEHVASYDELAGDCVERFGPGIGAPRPTELNELWHFAPGPTFVSTGVSRVLFTNGMQDMWSGGSYLEDLSDSILSINMINAAHHSDLTHTSLEYNEEHDTDDVKEAKERIAEILGTWIEEVKLESRV